MRWKVLVSGAALAVGVGQPAMAQTDVFGSTLLHRAVEQGARAEVSRLVEAGADVNAVNRYNVAPISLAVLGDDATLVRLLLEAGAAPNTLTGEGEPVLLTAAWRGQPDVVRALVDGGADVNLRERFYGQNAIMWASIENHAAVVHLLADSGADVNVRADILEGEPTWRYGADRRNGINGEALQNFNTNFSRGGLSPLMYAARHGSTEAILALLERGADPGAYDPEGFTPLLLAIMNAQYDAATALIDAGADVNQTTEQGGQTPLFAVADQRSLLWVYNRPTPKAQGALGSLDLARRLLDAGAEVDTRLTGPARRPMGGGGSAQTREGATALLRAAVVSDLELMRLLLERGADATVTTDAGGTALHFAAGVGWVDNTMSTAVGLGFATEADSIEALTMLLVLGLDLDAADDRGTTAMHGAASRGANEVVRFLAARGARLDAETRPREIPGNVNDSRARIEPGRTPIDMALLANPPRLGTVRVLRTLLGEDPEVPLPVVAEAVPQ
jgi:ankyrin repeat protein